MPLQDILRTDSALNTVDPLIESILEPAPNMLRNAFVYRMASDQAGVRNVLKSLGNRLNKAMTSTEKIEGYIFQSVVYTKKLFNNLF